MEFVTLELILGRWGQSVIRWAYMIIPMFVLLHIFKPQFLQKYRIRQIKEAKPRYLSEMIRSIFVFLNYVVPTIVLLAVKKYFGYSMMYTDIEQYGYFYFVLSIFIFFGFLETSLYWIHYAQHKIKIMYGTHEFHHRSVNTNPLTTYSTNFSETFMYMLPILVTLLVIPWHPTAYLIFAFIAIFHGGYIHSGYDFEIDPKTGQQRKFLSWHYSPTHHSLHHQKYNCNYGLYLTFWDRFNKTEDLSFETKNSN
jgi:Delta7-sterol 5-desaturase